MRRSFSFVFMGVLGFSAALGASSFGTSRIDFDDPTVDTGTVSEPLRMDGFVLTAQNASIFDQGNSDLALQLTASAAKSPDQTTAQATFSSSDSTPISADTFFTVENEDGSAFEFVSARFGGSVFDGDSSDVVVTAIGSLFGETELTTFGSLTFPGSFSAGAQIIAESFDPSSGTPLSGTALSSLSFAAALGGGSGGSSGQDGTGNNGEETVTVDDIELTSPQPVPVPASALLLATALAGVGVWGRRKKRS